MKTILAIVSGFCLCLAAFAAEVMPPMPAHYFNDYAGVVSTATAAQLDRQLEQFERDSSCQIVVAVYPKMQSDSSIEDYTVRVAQSWKAGQKGRDNGAVLFVFIQDHKMFLETGYGLEGALPDAICKRIIDNDIKPSFKAGNYDAGFTAGVNAILSAAKGEYKGNGRTVADHHGGAVVAGTLISLLPILFIVIFVCIFIAVVRSNMRQGGYYSRRGWTANTWGSGWNSGWGGGWGSGGGGGSSGGSSSFGGGFGGGFSGGGGSFGGGGAGGSW